MHLVFCAIAASVVGSSSRPSLSSSWISTAAITSRGAASLFTSHVEVPDLGSFDFLRSVDRLIERERARGRGTWSGWMPTYWLRLQLALMSGSRPGAEVAATAILSRQWLSPTLSAEAGHSSGGDAFSRVRVLTQSPYLDPALIRGFVYDYQGAYAGLEWGGQSVALSVGMGLTRVENVYQSIPGAAAGASNPLPAVYCARTAAIGPAAKLGLLIRM